MIDDAPVIYDGGLLGRRIPPMTREYLDGIIRRADRTGVTTAHLEEAGCSETWAIDVSNFVRADMPRLVRELYRLYSLRGQYRRRIARNRHNHSRVKRGKQA